MRFRDTIIKLLGGYTKNEMSASFQMDYLEKRFLGALVENEKRRVMRRISRAILSVRGAGPVLSEREHEVLGILKFIYAKLEAENDRLQKL